MCKGKNNIFNCIKGATDIARSGNISCHLLGWFDAMDGGRGSVRVRQSG